ncbi:MAG: VWA domain-containing protein, partial [Planctomycetes bacterium]|nr:VWA domain-containing protein [Planctomycetota bacterium]
MDILEQKRKTTIEDLLLLLLRTLMLLFLALAVCRPFFSDGLVSNMVGAQSDIVVLLDNSYSMDTQQGAQTRWDLAKNLSIKLVDEQNQGTGVALVLANKITEPIIADFSEDYSLIQETIRELPIGSMDSDWAASLSIAHDLLKKGSKSSKRLYVYSDFQISDWAELDPNTRKTIDAISKEVDITFISVNDQQSENISATELRIAAGALRIGSRATFTGVIHNHGKEIAEDIAVDFVVDGEVLESGTITVAAGQKANIHFQYEAFEKGAHQASIKIKGDILRKDNQAHRPFKVVDSVSVLAVSEGENDFGFLPTHFIELALNPFNDGSENEEAVYQFQNSNIGELAGEDLSQYSFVCLSAIRAISSVEATILEEYVSNGGGLIIFLGKETDVATYNANMHKAGAGLFPWELAVDSISESNENISMSIRALNFGHPVWSGLLSSENDYLKQVKLYSAYSFLSGKNDRAIPLAEIVTANNDNIDSGSKPVIVDFKTGRGHTLVITTSSDLSMNDFIT